MKHFLIMSVVMILMIFAFPIFAYTQVNYSDEILVYFSSGIAKVKNSDSFQIDDMEIVNVLGKFGMDQSNVSFAFPDFKESDTLHYDDKYRVIKLPNMSRIFKVKVPENVKRKDIIEELLKLQTVLFAEPNGLAAPSAIPNDTYFSYQWGLKNGSTERDIHATQAWDIYTGSSNNIIAIVDGGIDKTHPDLENKVFGGDNGYGWDGHGIHVAGIAAASTNNEAGVAGVDWYAKIHSQRVDNTDDQGTYNAIVSAVNYSTAVYVLNNSWSLVDEDDGPRYSSTVRMGFTYAYKMNRVAVVSMGNYYSTYPNQVYYPAGFGQGIIAVGATTSSDTRRPTSSIGDHIDVVAPGTSILSTYRDGASFSDPNYDYLSGTSMAAPHVSGIVSLLKGYNSSLYNDDIEHIIQISADDVNSLSYPGWDQYLGYGRVNAKKALDYLRSPYTINHLSASGGSSYSSTGTYTATMFGVEGLSDGVYIVKRYEVRKSVNFGQVFQSSPYVWGRGVVTNGFSAANPNFGMGWCDKVSSTNSSATLKTYIYKVWTISGTYLGWFPTTASNVTWAYTVLGVPVPLSVTISGLTYLSEGETGTFTANPSGGSGTYSNYQWWYRYDGEIEPLEKSVPGAKLPPVGTWYYLEDREGDQSIIFGPSYNFSLKCTVTDSKGSTATDVHTVIVEGLTLDLSIPDQLTVNDNSPNPFNLVTTIKYGIPESGLATITIYSITGQKVKTLVNDHLSAGYHQVQWNGTNNFGSEIASGLYILELKSGSNHVMKKLMFAK